jgi:hypothetical protein
MSALNVDAFGSADLQRAFLTWGIGPGDLASVIEQEATFTDELYVTFNGTKRSLPNMTQAAAESTLDFIASGGSAGNAHYSLSLSVTPGP